MLWSTVYLQRAIQAIKDHGHPAAKNALDNKADIAIGSGMAWARERVDDASLRRKTRPEDSPTFRVRY